MYSKSNVLLFIAYTVCAGLLVFSRRYEVQAESVDEQVTATVTAMTERVELERLESLERVITYNTFSYCQHSLQTVIAFSHTFQILPFISLFACPIKNTKNFLK